MRIAILTQADDFFIPKNISMLVEHHGISTIGVYVISSKGALANKKLYFLKGFGFTSALKYALKVVNLKLKDLLDKLSNYRMFNGAASLRGLCRYHDLPIRYIDNPNSAEVIKELERLKLDLVVSFSAPVVFKNELLDLPALGCINLHCSLLPYYAGLMPSFWTVLNREKETGVTVHKMDSKIDNGAIINQLEVEIPENSTVFEVISLTKRVGGELVVKSIEDFLNGEVVLKDNAYADGSYFSWPKSDDFIKFRDSGRKFI